MTDRSFQEKFVREFSAHLIGDQLVFKPGLYRNGQEPADLVWISARCAVVVYATSGNQGLDYKRKHNHGQMHRWLRRWRQGAVLKGPSVALGFDDLDHVIGISIVGGREAASVIEDQQVLYARSKDNFKLSACATLSDTAFFRLCRRSVGLRDLFDFLEYLRARNEIVSDEDALDWFDYWENSHVEKIRTEFSQILPDDDTLNASWNQTCAILAGIKSTKHSSGANGLLSALSFADAVWMSVAQRSIAEGMSQPGNRNLIGFAERVIREIKFLVFVAKHSMWLSPFHTNKINEYNVAMICMLDRGVDEPLVMMTFDQGGTGDFVCSIAQEFRDQTSEI